MRKVIIALFLGILTVTAFTGIANAQSTVGTSVNMTVAVNGYPENPSLQVPNAYVNMYRVRPVIAGVYEGELIETKTTLSNGNGISFTVNPGEIVDFVGFRTAEKATKSRHWTFRAPPYKNFTAMDNVAGRLCQINYLDTSSIMRIRLDNSESCATSLSVPSSDNYVLIAPPRNLSAIQGDVEIWLQATNDPLTVQTNATVRVFDEDTNALIGQLNSGTRGNVTLIIERNRLFYFDGWKNGTMYGGRTTPYTQTPRVWSIDDNGAIRNAYENESSVVLRLGGYPNSQLTVPPLPPQPTMTLLPSPSILQPTQNQVFTNFPRVADISWSVVNGAQKYLVEIECDTCGNVQWKSVVFSAGVSATNVTTSPLPGDNQYRVRVRAFGENSKSRWSEYRYFSYSTGQSVSPPAPTPTTILPSPSILQPLANQVLTNFPRTANISWSAVNGAQKYTVTVECDTCGTRVWKNIVFSTTVSNLINVTTTELPGDNQYRVRVRAFGENSKSHWSDYVYFSFSTPTPPVIPNPTSTPVIVPIPSVPSLVPPPSSSPRPRPILLLETPSVLNPLPGQLYTNFPRTAEITWTPVAGAQKYEVNVECDTCGTRVWKNIVFSTIVSNLTNVTTTELPGDNQYRVRVRAFGENSKSGWSDYVYFSYSTPSSPVILNPTSTPPVIIPIPSVPSLIPPPSSSPRPRPILLLETPSVLNPLHGQLYTNFPRTAEITWTPVAGAQKYEVNVECDTCGTRVWKNIVFSSIISNLTNVTTTELPGDNQYRVRVRAFGENSKSHWSDYVYFSYSTPTPPVIPNPTSTPVIVPIPSVPSLVPPPSSFPRPRPILLLEEPSVLTPLPGQIYTNFPRTADITWTPVLGVQKYEVNVECDTCGTRVWKNIVFSTTVSNLTNVTTTPLPGDNQYRVRVRAFGENSKSHWSDYVYFSFSTGNYESGLSAPAIISPVQAEVYRNYPRTAYIEWSAVNGAAQYDVVVECDTCGNVQWKSISYSAILPQANTNITTAPLPGDNQFRVKVRALSATSKGPWSEYRYFSFSTR